MVQILDERRDVTGQIGKGFGQGLSEQIPKEIDRYRLSQGLKNFQQNSSNQTPLEQYTSLLSIPGVAENPALLQSIPEILKQQGIRQGFSKRSGRENPEINTQNGQPSIQEVNFGNFKPQKNRIPSENVTPEEFGQPQVNPNNPLRQEAQPRSHFTKQQRVNAFSRNFEDFPGISLQENIAMVNDEEARYLAAPGAEREKDANLQAAQDQLRNKFTQSLETKLQKSGPGVFSDINGEMLNNLQRGMERELRINPNASLDDVANRWTTKALDLAKAKTQALSKAGSSQWAIPILANKEAYRNSLKEYADIFSNANNSEEYFNILKSNFGMSPSGAASLAFPRNDKLNKYTSKIKPQKIHDYGNYSSNSRKYAAEIEDLITSKDSLLGISRDLMEKDPYFDPTSFFSQLSEDKDSIGLNERQRRELAEGATGLIPSWADVLILPIFRGL